MYVYVYIYIYIYIYIYVYTYILYDIYKHIVTDVTITTAGVPPEYRRSYRRSTAGVPPEPAGVLPEPAGVLPEFSEVPLQLPGAK